MDSRDVNEYSPPEVLLSQYPDACAEIYAIGMIFWVRFSLRVSSMSINKYIRSFGLAQSLLRISLA